MVVIDPCIELQHLEYSGDVVVICCVDQALCDAFNDCGIPS